MGKLKLKTSVMCPKNAGAVLILITLVELIVLESCSPGTAAERFAHHDEAEEVVITALIPEQKPGVENTAAKLVLESGNYWSAGIPGFGENALSAFVGEYRIPGETEKVKVWLTMEFIYYEGWTNRGINGLAVLEKTADDGRIIASSLNEYWTAVVQLPLGTGLSDEDQNRIISNLINSLSGFSGQNRNVSLPALVEYQ